MAVSTIVSRYRQPFKVAAVGVFWGIGHTTTLFLAGIAVLVFKLAIPDGFALGMEFVVGLALVALGIQTLREHRPPDRHVHIHEHGGQAHAHEHAHRHKNGEDEAQHHNPRQHRSLIMGMIHGLAGSGALILLVLGTAGSTMEGIAYILVFGLGSILGMVIITTLISLPFAVSSRSMGSFNRAIRLTAGALSIGLGLFITISLAIAQRVLQGIQ